MRYFKPKPGTKSAVRILNTPFADITAFSRVVRSLILMNPIGCTAYRSVKKSHPPSGDRAGDVHRKIPVHE
jgi:hypothetical protein